MSFNFGSPAGGAAGAGGFSFGAPKPTTAAAPAFGAPAAAAAAPSAGFSFGAPKTTAGTKTIRNKKSVPVRKLRMQSIKSIQSLPDLFLTFGS